MYKIAVILILFSALTCQAQIPEDFPVFGKTDLPEAKFKPARYFTGESLFGYMNGGAELYREYGITDAVITEFEVDNRYYKCEMFRMNGPEEAFGIYSVSKFKCLDSPGFSRYTCRNKYQVQVCAGQYYISVINRSGTAADSVVSLRTAKIISEKILDPSFNPAAFLPGIDPEVIKSNTVLVRGKLGLANGAPEWEDYFRDQLGYTALIWSQADEKVLSVRFVGPEEFNLFISFHGWGLCELSVTDVPLSAGVTMRIIGDNHLLLRFSK